MAEKKDVPYEIDETTYKRFEQKNNILFRRLWDEDLPTYGKMFEVNIENHIKSHKEGGITMPIFEYNCEDCNYIFNQLLISRDTQVKCPLCQGDVKKLMSTFSVGVSHNATSNLPEMAGPKMCTNC